MCQWAKESVWSNGTRIDTLIGAIPMCKPVTCGFTIDTWVEDQLSVFDCLTLPCQVNFLR